MTNPFKKNTTSYHDWEVLKDLKWHCTKCELKSGQAKTWQTWRQEKGIQLDKDEKGNWFKTIQCPTCGIKTVHRKLKSLEILDETKSRSGISSYLSRKVKNFYNNEEALFLREFNPRELEVDHKFPQIRWRTDEEENKNSMSEAEIKEKFILLTRSNNLLKSRQCENVLKKILEVISQVFTFGIKAIKNGKEYLKVMSLVVLVVFGMIHINGEKN